MQKPLKNGVEKIITENYKGEMKMKYKVGDKVRVKKGLKGGNYYGGLYFGYGMEAFCGKEFVITRTRSAIDIHLEDVYGWSFSEEMLEPVTNSKIVITTDGKETLARLYEGNKVVKSAKAICSDDDEFDFSKGAEIAFDRLAGRRKPDNLEEPKFKVGDLVVKIDDYKEQGYAPVKGTVGRIVSKGIVYPNRYYVQWEMGSTRRAGRWWIDDNHIRKVNI